MSEEKNFRFPLALLALVPESPESTLDHIVSYCAREAGSHYSGNAIERAREILEEQGKKGGAKPKSHGEAQAIIGASLSGIKIYNPANTNRKADICWRYLADKGSAAKNTVNISRSWFWRAIYTARQDFEALDGAGEISWREFTILCALLSRKGKKPFFQCGWKEIQARAMGFCGKKDMNAAPAQEIERRRPFLAFLTQDKIGRTVSQFERDRWFAKYIYRTGARGGDPYYSFSTKEKGDPGREELATWVCRMKSKYQVQGNREKDIALTRRLKQSFYTKPDTLREPDTLKGNEVEKGSKQPDSHPITAPNIPDTPPDTGPDTPPDTLTKEGSVTKEGFLTQEGSVTQEVESQAASALELSNLGLIPKKTECPEPTQAEFERFIKACLPDLDGVKLTWKNSPSQHEKFRLWKHSLTEVNA